MRKLRLSLHNNAKTNTLIVHGKSNVSEGTYGLFQISSSGLERYSWVETGCLKVEPNSHVKLEIL